MSSLLGLVARSSLPVSRTLRTRVSFSPTCTLLSHIHMSQKRAIAAKPKILSSDELGVVYINSSASLFKNPDLSILRTSFQPAICDNEIIPAIEATNFPSQYVLPEINGSILEKRDFDVNKLDKISDRFVKAFLYKLHAVVKNAGLKTGTSETITDSMVNHLLLRTLELDSWPLVVNNRPHCELLIGDVSVSADPEFVINKENFSIVVIEDKQLKNRKIGQYNGFGETQLACEMLALGDENNRLAEEYRDQTIFAVRIISTYVTLYKTTISAAYWEELGRGLPVDESVIIKRWPGENGLTTGFDLAEPDGRKAVLTALVKIRQSLLQ